MKYLFPVILLLFLSCCDKTSENLYFDVIVLVDLTELEDTKTKIDVQKLLSKELLRELGIKKSSKFMGFGEIKLYQLYDYSSNRPEIIECPKPNGINQSKVQREDELEVFKNKLQLSLNKCLDHPYLSNDTIEFRQSYIIEPIHNSCLQFSNSKAPIKKLIVFSDMLENSDLFSFYKSDSIKNSFFKVIQEKLSECNFTDVELKIVFTPNRKKNNIQRIAKECWTEYFKSKNPKKLDFNTYLVN